MAITVTTPRGQIIRTTTKSGAVKAELSWNPNFAPQKSQNFTRAQKFVDSEVLRYCSAMVPFQTGMLDKSGKLGTVIGSGNVQYIAHTPEHSIMIRQRADRMMQTGEPNGSRE